MADLRSRAYMRVLDLVSEGPIKGWVHPADPMRDIYLNDTPMKGPDGTLNFHGVDDAGNPVETSVSFDYRLGTVDQTHMQGLPAVESAIAVNVEVPYGAPVSRTFNDANLTSVRVILKWPSGLFSQNKKGGTNEWAVNLKIYLQEGVNPEVLATSDYVSGKSLSEYQKEYIIPLSGTGPWTIKVERVDPDDAELTKHSTFFWDTYVKIIDSKLRYPYSAVVDVSADASAFSSIPGRSYDLYLKVIKIPTNYDPVTRTYTGVWDGTFKEDWTDNPAWIWYDLVTNERYGLGKYIDPSMVDKWELYKIARYCDAVDANGNYVGVPTGRKDTNNNPIVEPRFSCNVYLSNRQEAFKVINDLATVFRSMVFYSAGVLTPAQDAPTLTSHKHLFVNANVIDGIFTYQGSSRAARHTVALVAWNNPDDGYRVNYEYVEHAEGIARYGVREIQTTAIGCTSRSQANRMGRWLLYTDQMETETVSFSVGLEGNIVTPGKIIDIQDSHRVSARYGGRIVSTTSNTVTIDHPLTIEAGKSYSMEVMLPDMTMGTVTITNAPGTYTTLTISPSFVEAPQSQAVWMVVVNDLAPTTWRVVNVEESDKHTYDILAVAHNPSKYNHIDLGEPLQTAPVIRDPNYVPKAFDVTITEGTVITTLGVKLTLTFSWKTPNQIFTYLVEWRKGGDNWTPMPETGLTTVDLIDVVLGVYQCRVTCIDPMGKRSAPAYSAPYTMTGKTDAPDGLSSLIAEGGLWEINLKWTFHPGQDDLLGTEIWVSDQNDRSTAQLLTNVAYPITKSAELNLLNGITHYYWGRCIDTSGNYSEWYPMSPLAGVQATTINDAEKILTILSGAIAGSNAGLTIGQRLDALDYPGTGLSDSVVNLQSDLTSTTSSITDLGSRLMPGGDIHEAIYRTLAITSVSVPTPIQSLPPSNPVIGMAYYDSDEGNALKFYTGSAWVNASTATVQSTAPTAPSIGDLWRDTSTSKQWYRIWDGTTWVFAVRPTIYGPTQPPTSSAYPGDTWMNTTPDPDVLYVFNGTIWVDTTTDTFAAISAAIQAVQTSSGGLTTQVQQNMTSINGLLGLWSIKIDNNGFVSGIALSSELLPGGSGATSTMVIDVNKFAVGDSSISPVYPFIIQNGQVYIKESFIGKLGVTSFYPGTTMLDPSYPSNPFNTVGFGTWNGISVWGDVQQWSASCRFYGPAHSGVPQSQRVKTGSVKFFVAVNATFDHFMTLWYRKNGGGWVPITTVVEPQTSYGFGGISVGVEVWMGVGDYIDFGISATDGAGGILNGGKLALQYGSMTVLAFNF